VRVRQKADLAAAPLTVNTDREGAVQFLAPAFMTFDLAMLMRKRHKSSDVQSIGDLEQKTHYKPGVVSGGSTANFLGRSRYSVMWSRMVAASNRNVSFPASVEEGVRRVRESSDDHPYVFIGEQYTLEYHASRKPCDLVVVKGKERVLDGEYRLAVKQGYTPAAHVDKLQAALTKLNDSGRLDELYKKWWKDRSQCSRAPASTTITSGTAILVPILLATLMRLSGE